MGDYEVHYPSKKGYAAFFSPPKAPEKPQKDNVDKKPLLRTTGYSITQILKRLNPSVQTYRKPKEKLEGNSEREIFMRNLYIGKEILNRGFKEVAELETSVNNSINKVARELRKAK